MKRKSGRGQSEATGNRSGGKAVGRVADEESKNVEPRFLRQSRERIDRI